MKKKHHKKWNLSRMKQQKEDYRQQIELQCLYIEGTTVTDKWEELKKQIVRSAKQNIGYIKEVPAKKPWITEHMISRMKQRTKWKSINTE